MQRTRTVRATEAERTQAVVGDDLVTPADAVMDRGFDLPGTAEEVWPWIQQLGKQRAGWYLSHRVERLVPASRRAERRVVEHWQRLRVGDVIPDYGGRHETFEVAIIDPPRALVYTSTRGTVRVSWAIVLTELPGPRTRVHLRLRLGPVKRRWLVHTFGELLDYLTIAGLAAGLAERLRDRSGSGFQPEG